MKEKTKKYVAGVFMSVLYGVHFLYGYLPHENTQAQDFVSTTEGNTYNSGDAEVSITSGTQDEPAVVDTGHSVLIGTTSKTNQSSATELDAPTITKTVTDIAIHDPAIPAVEPPLSAKPRVINGYKNGTYVGTRENAYYGYVQVQLTFKDGNIINAITLESPHKQRQSQKINKRAIPLLQTEAVVAQSAGVDAVSGASYTSKAFKKSLTSAIQEAKA